MMRIWRWRLGRIAVWASGLLIAAVFGGYLFVAWFVGDIERWLSDPPAEMTFPPPPPMTRFLPVCYDPDRSNPERTLWTEQYEMPNEDFRERLIAGLQRIGAVHAVKDGVVYIHDSFNDPPSGDRARGPYRRIQARWFATRGVIYQRLDAELRPIIGHPPNSHEVSKYFGVVKDDRGLGDCRIFRHYFLGPVPWAPEE